MTVELKPVSSEHFCENIVFTFLKYFEVAGMQEAMSALAKVNGALSAMQEFYLTLPGMQEHPGIAASLKVLQQLAHDELALKLGEAQEHTGHTGKDDCPACKDKDEPNGELEAPTESRIIH